MADSTITSMVTLSNCNHFISVKLSRTNYLFWKIQITLFLEGYKLIGFVDGTQRRPSPKDPNYGQWVQQDKLVMSVLISTVSEDVSPMVIGIETSHDIWVSLEIALSSNDTSQLELPKKPSQNRESAVTHMDHSLYESAKVGDLDALKRNKSQLHIQLTPCKNTLLHVLAQFHDDAQYVKEIFVMQSSTIKQSLLKWKNSKDETALHIAAKLGRLCIVDSPIQHAKSLDREELESNINIAKEMTRTVDHNGDTALHLAVRSEHVEVVKLLVEEDPYCSRQSNKKKETPLYIAVEMDNHSIVESILTTCKSPAYRGPGGKTALHVAVINDSGDQAF